MYKENQEYCENVIAVSNRHLCKRPFLEQIKIVCEWHPKALILREKDLTEAEYEQLAGQVMKICKTYKVPCILHNFWQIAAARAAAAQRLHGRVRNAVLPAGCHSGALRRRQQLRRAPALPHRDRAARNGGRRARVQRLLRPG